MSKFLFAWEFGGGLGHAARIKPLAEELLRRGHSCALMLRDLVQTDRVLNDLNVPKLQAPIWLHRGAGRQVPPISLAEILLGNGYLRADHLSAQIDGWLAAFKLWGAEVVVADYAPSAVLAARIAGIPSATVGLGFYMPPATNPMPAFRDWGPVSPARVAIAEAKVLASVNAVLASRGRTAIDALWRLYAGDMPLLCTWPELDHYGRSEIHQIWWGPNFLPKLAKEADGPLAWPAGTGPRVFAYLKAGHPDHARWLQALVDKGCRVLCYMPEVASSPSRPVQSTAIQYAMHPVDVGRAAAECELLVCHAGEATLVQGLLAGRPVLLLPMHPEQFLIARCVELAGLGVNVAQHPRTPKSELLARLLDRHELKKGARAFATRYSHFSHAKQSQLLADRFEHLLSDQSKNQICCSDSP